MKLMKNNPFILVGVLGLVSACASGTRNLKTARPEPARSVTPQVNTVELEPLKVEVTKTPEGDKFEAFDAASLFEQAGAHLEAQRFTEAVVAYDRLVANFPDSRYAVAALYNAGLALEGKQDYTGAAARYRVIVEKNAQSKDVLDALFRLGACEAELNHWAASAQVFAQALARSELSTGDRIEALARRGLAQYQLKDRRGAERTFRDALQVFHANEAAERLDNDFFVAMSFFYLAEISHDDFRDLPLRLPQKQLAKDLETKAEALLVAQTRYVDTARLKNPAWATAAGHQMATLYKEFYDAMLMSPTPPELQTEELKTIYFDELKKKIEPLLRKAVRAHELTLGVAERFGIDNEWVRKSNEQMDELRALLNPEEKATRPAAEPSAAPPSMPERRNQLPITPRPEPGADVYHPRVVL